jgi:Holliday junction resolvase
MSSYRKGVRLENQIVAHFDGKDGWFANRFTARGNMDVAAWTDKIGFVIECKNKKLTERQAWVLYEEMRVRFSNSLLRPVLVYKNLGGKITVMPEVAHWAFEGIL